MIAGIIRATGGEDIRSHLHLDGLTAHSNQGIANRVNLALLELMPDDILLEVCNALLELNPSKASGPDGINNWLRQDYADFPVCGILNASFSEHKLARCRKDADVTPLMKEKPVTTIAKHIRPMSLTPALSKLVEDFVVSKHFGSAVLELIDSDQFRAIPNSLTLHARISMIHTSLCAWITERPFTW